MPSALPWYRRYPKDFLTSERYQRMTSAERGLYNDCLDYAWINDGIPDDPRFMARALQLTYRDVAKSWKKVREMFTSHASRPGYLVNSRAEKERKAASRETQVPVESTKRVAKEKSLRTRACASESESVSESSGNTPNTEKPERAREVEISPPVAEEKKPAAVNGHGFVSVAGLGPDDVVERLYRAFPRKKNKPLVEEQVRRIWARSRDPASEFEEIHRVLLLWISCDEWQRDRGRWVPSLDRWLADEGYTAEPQQKPEFDW